MDRSDGASIAELLHKYALSHLSKPEELYRIFVYDAPPMDKSVRLPISKRGLHLGKTETSKTRLAFFEALKKKRKTALRLGRLDPNSSWTLKPEVQKKLLSGMKTWEELVDDDFTTGGRQKQVDMKLGLDIASLALKQLVTKIILISGDSDFVPAAKLARREGIDFVLDPMWNPISPDLNEHVDGIITRAPRPEKS